MSAVSASIYTDLTIEKNGKTVDLSGATSSKTLSIDYYESLYSPMITVNLINVDDGGSTPNDKEDLGTVKDNLPITGGEEVSIKIESKSGILDLTKNPLVVSSAPIMKQDTLKQVTFLSLVSPYEVLNRDLPVRKKLKGKINQMVSKLIKEIDVPEERVNIEETLNMDAIIGRSKTPYDLIISLAKKSIPHTNGDPGYFFYETQDGLNFKSIDTLIRQNPTATYRYEGVLRANSDNDANDFKILESPIFKKDQNIVNALKSGTYKARVITTNPLTHEITEKFVNLRPTTTLGKDPESKDPSDRNKAIRTYHNILDIGSMETDVGYTDENNPFIWEAKSAMRYDLLHSQVVDIQVPCNVNLRAGEVIECMFEKITKGDKANTPVNEQQSGKYLILHLCHHFTPAKSYTSLTLARDTYGLYSKE